VKLLALAELIPLALMGAAAQTPPGCVEQRPANEASVTAASGTLEDLSLYRPRAADSEPDSTQDCHQEASLSTGTRIDAATHARIDAAADTKSQCFSER
jgi:hypothetical protein